MPRSTVTILILAAMWVPPGLAIVTNRFNPNIGTALGVPYAFLAGLLLAAGLTIVVALSSQRWPVMRPHYIVLACAALLTLGLFAAANQGLLSTVTR